LFTKVKELNYKLTK